MNSTSQIASAQPGSFLRNRSARLSVQAHDRLDGRLKFSSVLSKMFQSTNARPNSKPSDCLMLHRLPARLDAAQTAALLGFQPHDIPVLTRLGLLKPLGRPAPNSTRYFAAIEIDRLREDREWLDKATRAIGRRWQEKNRTLVTKPDPSLQTE